MRRECNFRCCVSRWHFYPGLVSGHTFAVYWIRPLVLRIMFQIFCHLKSLWRTRFLHCATRIAVLYNAFFFRGRTFERTHVKAPGRDAIHNRMLRHEAPRNFSYFLNMRNRIGIDGSFPSRWVKAVLIHILKQVKTASFHHSPPIMLS